LPQATIALLITGIIQPRDAWSGFSQPGVLSVGVLFAVAEGVQEAGAVDVVLRAMLGQPTSLPVALIRLLVPVACISAFMNNTPVVAMLIPVIDGWSTRIGFHKSHFLMPLSFASMLGGCCTLLGTSTNLVANAVLNSAEYNFETLTMFELAPVGVPLTMAGALYMALVSGILLKPTEKQEEEARGASNQGAASAYRIAFKVAKDSIVCGETVERSGIGRMDGCEIREFTTAAGQEVYGAKEITDEVLEPDSVVLFHASAQGVVKLRRLRGLLPLSEDFQAEWEGINSPEGDLLHEELSPEQRTSSRRQSRIVNASVDHVTRLGRKRRHRRLYEAVLDRGSPLCDTGVDDALIREVYEAAVLSVRRGGDTETEKSPRRKRQGSAASSPMHDHNRCRSDTVESLVGPQTLQPGDTLLLEANPNFQRVFSKTSHFALVREVEGSKPPRHDEGMDQFRMFLSLAILIAMVVAAATGALDLLPAALLTVGVLVASKCISLDEAFRAVKGRVLLAIVVTFGVSSAMKSTGVADFTAEGIVALCTPLGPRGLIAAIFLVGACVGCVVSNNATVILMLPICFSVAEKVDGVTFKQLVVTLLMAASASFLTPISYQTNLMVYGPGGYAFTSFAKFGAPLVLIMMVLNTILVPMVY